MVTAPFYSTEQTLEPSTIEIGARRHCGKAMDTTLCRVRTKGMLRRSMMSL